MRFEVAKIFLTIKHFRMCCFGQDASSALTASIFSTVIIEKNQQKQQESNVFHCPPSYSYVVQSAKTINLVKVHLEIQLIMPYTCYLCDYGYSSV